ncbi:MAG TPA: hypothetical protein VGM14_03120 [Streptosporangiaceae bacterium]
MTSQTSARDRPEPGQLATDQPAKDQPAKDQPAAGLVDGQHGGIGDPVGSHVR